MAAVVWSKKDGVNVSGQVQYVHQCGSSEKKCVCACVNKPIQMYKYKNYYIHLHKKSIIFQMFK